MTDRVDVGVVTWNTADLTVAALRRLLDTDQGCELRLLVHDNASVDGTVDALADAVPEAEVVRSPENLGFAAGVNRLLARSDARWFLALNSDAWPEPGAVGRLLAAGDAHPRTAAVAARLLRPDGSLEHSTHPFPSLALAAADALGLRPVLSRRWAEARCLEGAWEHDRPRPVDWAVGAALLLRRRAVEEIGGLDEGFFMYVEDLEWCWRAYRHGWEVRFEPSAVVRHVGNVSGARRHGERRAALETANLRRFTDTALGPAKARWYRAFEDVALSRRYLTARVAGDRPAAAHWRLQLRAALGLLAPPPAGAPAPAAVVEAAPRVAVVVPTRGRAERAERLVTALQKQTLPADQFEVVVVEDASEDDTAAVLSSMGLSPMPMRLLRMPERRGPAAARNAGWRSTAAPVVAFTDDDCVPDPDWLRAGLEAMGDGARVAVGRTGPPDDQLPLLGRPFARALVVDSSRFFETCNVFYRRADLEAVGGFDERFRRPSGEDTHLGLRVAELGVEPVFAEDALVHHDVRAEGLLAALRESWRWADLPLVLKDRPYARRPRATRLVFWKETHPRALLALAGLVLVPRRRSSVVLVAPWLWWRLRRDPVAEGVGARLRTLPGAFALDLTEVATMVRGSVRHGTFLL